LLGLVAVLAPGCGARSDLEGVGGGGGGEATGAEAAGGPGGGSTTAPPVTAGQAIVGGVSGAVPGAASVYDACPLDPAARSALVPILGAAIADATWIIGKSALGDQRGFAGTAALAGASVHGEDVITTTCETPGAFSALCEPSTTPSGLGYRACHRFLCRGPFVVAVDAWIEPVPLEGAAGAPSLDTFEHTASFAPNAAGVTAGWATRYELADASGRMVAVQVSGGGHVGSATQPNEALLAVFVDGLAQARVGAWAARTVIVDASSTQGGAQVGDVDVLRFDEATYEWVGPCVGAPGGPMPPASE
jgi:hypothetical protein